VSDLLSTTAQTRLFGRGEEKGVLCGALRQDRENAALWFLSVIDRSEVNLFVLVDESLNSIVTSLVPLIQKHISKRSFLAILSPKMIHSAFDGPFDGVGYCTLARSILPELEQLAMILVAPHSGFSRLILRIRSRPSLAIGGRPPDNKPRVEELPWRSSTWEGGNDPWPSQ
jgi:hypothetical protein